uniref:Uncharacterized protein n=1 Tax=Oryza nivara TaxID=4536 RepID=A0A0E0I6Z1_ORYNI
MGAARRLRFGLRAAAAAMALLLLLLPSSLSLALSPPPPPPPFFPPQWAPPVPGGGGPFAARNSCPKIYEDGLRSINNLSPSLSLFLQPFDGVEPVAPPRSGGGRRDDGRRRRGGRWQVCQAGAVVSEVSVLLLF